MLEAVVWYSRSMTYFDCLWMWFVLPLAYEEFFHTDLCIVWYFRGMGALLNILGTKGHKHCHVSDIRLCLQGPNRLVPFNITRVEGLWVWHYGCVTCHIINLFRYSTACETDTAAILWLEECETRIAGYSTKTCFIWNSVEMLAW